MRDTNQASDREWTKGRAMIVMVLCLGAGIAGGWMIRGLRKPAASGSVAAASVPAPTVNDKGAGSPMPAPARLEEIADAQAAPLLNKLKSNPNDPELLANIGNLYYDAQQYPNAIQFYRRALEVKPAEAAVRTDMGTAYWYMGNADLAIAEFDKALTFAPDNPNTLFNRGLVRWKGKRDGAGAIADWNQLLAANPNYEGKEQVEKMMAEVRTAERSGRN
jgi:cytochrome c-type biogenesis protein CcmH/NrfG